MATTSPWTLDARDFLSQVQPLMAKSAFTDYEKLVGGRYSGGEGGDYTPYSDAASNRWSQQDSTPQDVTLTLADGRKWTPSGHGNGIVFHPKGEVTQGGWKGGENGGYEQIVNPEGYYEVSGDASKLLGKDNAGQSVTVRYKQVGDKMVPMEDAQYQGYSKGVWNNGLKQFAMIGAMAVGGWALSPVVAAAGTAATAAGAAGWMGMAPGLAATAVNTGLLSTGVSLATGHNIGDSIKTGFASAALSGVGGWANESIGGATAGLGATTSKALSTIGSGAITGGAGAVLTGQDVGEGIKGGIISSGIRAIGNVASKEVKDLVGTDNPVAGRIAGGVVNSAITGSSPLGVMVGEVTKTVGGFDTLSKEQQATVNSVVASAIKGKKLTPKQIIDLAAATVKDVKQA